MGYLEEGNADAIWLCSNKKTNILLLGDSIRLGFEPLFKELTENEFSVFSPDENCCMSQNIIISLKRWSNMFDFPEKVDVIHFNCGHWDAAHWLNSSEPVTSVGEYEKNIGIIIDILKRLFPNAKIIFATTTPMNPVDPIGHSENPRTNPDIDIYNTVGAKEAKEHGIYVNDLNSFCRGWGEEAYADYCHFTKESYKKIAEYTAKFIKDIL